MEYLPLYLASCDNKKSDNSCGLISSLYLYNWYIGNNNQLPLAGDIFNYAMINDYLNGEDNKNTFTSILPLMINMQQQQQQQLHQQQLHQQQQLQLNSSGRLLSYGRKKRSKKKGHGGGGLGEQNKLDVFYSQAHQFHSAVANFISSTSFSGGSKRNKDLLVFGGGKYKQEDNIAGISMGGSIKQNGGQTVSPSDFNSSSTDSNSLESYSTTDYSSYKYGSKNGGRTIQGCNLGDTTMNCSDNIPNPTSSMTLGNAFNSQRSELLQNGGSQFSLEGSTLDSTSSSNGQSMESQSIFNDSNLNNRLSIQNGGNQFSLEGSTLDSTSRSNGQSMESQSIFNDSNLNNGLSTQNESSLQSGGSQSEGSTLESISTCSGQSMETQSISNNNSIKNNLLTQQGGKKYLKKLQFKKNK